MKLFKTIAITALASLVRADWTIKDGQATIIHKGVSLLTEEFSRVDTWHLPQQASLELTFTTDNGKSGARAHQTLAMLTDESTGLQFSYAPSMNVKPNGKAKITIAHKSIPAALQNAGKLTLSLVIGSFDDGIKPVNHVITTDLEVDEPSVPAPEPSRLGAKPEIRYMFRPDPKKVAAPVALFFAAGAILLLVGVLGFFAATGSFSGFGKALQVSPIGHLGLLGSLFAFEAVFLMYFRGQSIFITLGELAVIGSVAVLTGSGALRELKLRLGD